MIFLEEVKKKKKQGIEWMEKDDKEDIAGEEIGKCRKTGYW